MEYRSNGLMKSVTAQYVVMTFALLLGSCKEKTKNEVDLVTFKIKGEVVSVDMKAKRVTISHEEIPNYMMAMTMPFKVKDSTLLVGVSKGDSVQGTLAVSRSESWLETLSVIGQGEPKRSE